MGRDRKEFLEACRDGDVEKVKSVIASKKRPRTPLSFFGGSWLSGCKDVNSGYTALHFSALRGHTEIVRMVLTHAEMTGSPSGKDTPLHLLTMKDRRGCLPIHLAAWNGHLETVKVLLEPDVMCETANAQNNARETPLHLSAQHGHSKVVSLLLQQHADPTPRNARGETALDLASRFGRTGVVRLLVTHSPSLVLMAASEPDPVDLRVPSASPRHPRKNSSSLASPVSRTHSNSSNSTNLEQGIFNQGSTKFLAGPPCSPLHLAARNGQLEVVKVLLDSGFDVNWLTEEGSALHVASLFGKTGLVRYLLQRGIRVDHRDWQGRTVLEVLDEHQNQKSTDLTQLMQSKEAWAECRKLIQGKSSPMDPQHGTPSRTIDDALMTSRRKPGDGSESTMPSASEVSSHSPRVRYDASQPTTVRNGSTRSPSQISSVIYQNPDPRLKPNRDESPIWQKLPDATMDRMKEFKAERDAQAQEEVIYYPPSIQAELIRGHEQLREPLGPHEPLVVETGNEDTISSISLTPSLNSPGTSSLREPLSVSPIARTAFPAMRDSEMPIRPPRRRRSGARSPLAPIKTRQLSVDGSVSKCTYQAPVDYESLLTSKASGYDNVQGVSPLWTRYDNVPSNLLAYDNVPTPGQHRRWDHQCATEIRRYSDSNRTSSSRSPMPQRQLDASPRTVRTNAPSSPPSEPRIEADSVQVQLSSATTGVYDNVRTAVHATGFPPNDYKERSLSPSEKSIIDETLELIDQSVSDFEREEGVQLSASPTDGKAKSVSFAAAPAIEEAISGLSLAPTDQPTSEELVAEEKEPEEKGSGDRSNLAPLAIPERSEDLDGSTTEGEAGFDGSSPDEPSETEKLVENRMPSVPRGTVEEQIAAINSPTIEESPKDSPPSAWASQSKIYQTICPMGISIAGRPGNQSGQSSPIGQMSSIKEQETQVEDPSSGSDSFCSCSEETSTGGDSKRNSCLITEDESADSFADTRISGISESTNAKSDESPSELFKSVEQGEYQSVIQDNTENMQENPLKLAQSKSEENISNKEEPIPKNLSKSVAGGFNVEPNVSGKASPILDESLEWQKISEIMASFGGGVCRESLYSEQFEPRVTVYLQDRKSSALTLTLNGSATPPSRGRSEETTREPNIANDLSESNISNDHEKAGQREMEAGEKSGRREELDAEMNKECLKEAPPSPASRRIDEVTKALSEFHPTASWLMSLGVEATQADRLSGDLIRLGYDRMDFMKHCLTEEVLNKRIGIQDFGLIRKIIEGLNELPEWLPESKFSAHRYVSDWLMVLGCQDYLGNFMRAGFDMIQRVAAASWNMESLRKVLGISLPGHSTRILLSLAWTGDTFPTNLSVSNTKPPEKKPVKKCKKTKHKSETPLLSIDSPDKELLLRTSIVMDSTTEEEMDSSAGGSSATDHSGAAQDSTVPPAASLNEPLNEIAKVEERKAFVALKTNSADRKSAPPAVTSSEGPTESATPKSPPGVVELSDSTAEASGSKTDTDEDDVKIEVEETTYPWKHDPSELIHKSVSYSAHYLGSTLIVNPAGADGPKQAIIKLKKTIREIAKIPQVVLEISYKGVRVSEGFGKKLICEHLIHNIHCVCQDERDLNCFAYITKDGNRHFCHAFSVLTADVATGIILSLGQAFEVAYQLATRTDRIAV